MSRFIQGDGRPILYRYNSSNVLQATVNMPYVPDTQNSFVRQEFIPYPDERFRMHELLGGYIEEDSPVVYTVKILIKYSSITAAALKDIYNMIITAKGSTNYLKIRPRADYDDGDADYRVIFKGSLPIESKNQWTHNVDLLFETSTPISSPDLQIPPLTPS